MLEWAEYFHDGHSDRSDEQLILTTGSADVLMGSGISRCAVKSFGWAAGFHDGQLNFTMGGGDLPMGI